jgi:hypothetical protein
MIRDPAIKPGFTLRVRMRVWGAIAALLLLPLVAMQFTTEVKWGAEDFAVAATLLIGAGLALEVAARVLVEPVRRALAAAVILGVVVLVWAELAVGLFD